jgi:RIO kinase 1
MTKLPPKEEYKVEKGVFDEFTERNLFELRSHNVFDQLLGPVKIGKESNVFLALKREEQKEKKIIVKIYRLQNCDYRGMYDYIRKDPRYEFLKKHRREIIFAWVQREYKNLLKAERTQANVPKPLAWKFNILVEEMIGEEEPAPALKDALPENPAQFLEQIIEQIKKLYQVGLIHGDLSAFNILNYDEKPYLIDFSQGTLTKTPNSLELLERDIKNILAFFARLNVKADSVKILEKVTNS